MPPPSPANHLDRGAAAGENCVMTHPQPGPGLTGEQTDLFPEEPADRADPGALEGLFGRLSRSKFRARFTLNASDRAYALTKGRDMLRRHAGDFIARRLAPAHPTNDGKQTPMRGHPVFVAQHATATCCRGCLAKWHGLEEGRVLSDAEQLYVVEVVMTWISKDLEKPR